MLFKILKKLDYYIQPLLIVTLIIGVGIQVLYRFIPNFEVPWSLEFISFVFGASVWFGISIAIKEDAHVGITFIVDMLPIKYKKIVLIIQNIIFCIFIIWIGYLGSESILYYYLKGIKTPAMAAPYYIVRIPIVFGCLYSCYRLIEKIVLIKNSSLEN
ncbi:TRAP transporter small permease [Halocella sp. SP3-1]|uniref:TRAP transporter small permease n=1 Tax=Halocella sp. SP3-1 TaxID=2382161 RepID=UPI000F754CD8|nr:TRAP transporter small permease [Halocella sp. SP3-1]AZO93655.1 TRAP transporter small permease [Halocella sp. SP3-1]